MKVIAVDEGGGVVGETDHLAVMGGIVVPDMSDNQPPQKTHAVDEGGQSAGGASTHENAVAA